MATGSGHGKILGGIPVRVAGSGHTKMFDGIAGSLPGSVSGREYGGIPYLSEFAVILMGEARAKPVVQAGGKETPKVLVSWGSRGDAVIRSDYVITNDVNWITPVVGSTLGELVGLTAHLRTLVGYRLFRSQSGTGFTPDDDNMIAGEDTLLPGVETYEDLDVVNDQTYYYKVCAIASDVSQ